MFPEQNAQMPGCSAANRTHCNLPQLELYLRYINMKVSWMSKFENDAGCRLHNGWICLFLVYGFVIHANLSIL